MESERIEREKLEEKPLGTNVTINLSFDEYKKMFDRAKEYVGSGDIYQVKISMRYEFDASFDPWKIYKKLRVKNPSPYAAFLDLDGVALVSCSPEELVRIEIRFWKPRYGRSLKKYMFFPKYLCAAPLIITLVVV